MHSYNDNYKKPIDILFSKFICKMEREYDKSIRPILDTFDKIREILRFEKIELPKIVVVGDQSAGKSSVLESITGISLPRGENTVTKCPIVIQIRGIDCKNQESANVRIEGDEVEKAESVPLEELHKKINEKQNQILNKAGTEITDTPLYVNVKKQNAPDLTLYDLPGITYKSDSLTTNIRNIIAKYTTEKQTLVLLVLAANTDLTTSEAISLIRKNEDYKDRTLAIITKIDLVANHEKRLFSKIMNNELDLRYNPIVVRNRTQDELERNEGCESVKQKEKQLIDSCDQLKLLPEDSKGTSQLIIRLVQLQKEKLLNSKIEIRTKIIDKINLLNQQVSELPLPADTPTEKFDRFKECVFNLSHYYDALIKGQYLDIDDEVEVFPNLTKNIREKFEKFFLSFESKKEYFFSPEFNKKVIKVMDDTRGFKLANFADQDSFHQLMKKEISSVASKTQNLIFECSEELKDAIFLIVKKCFKDFPKLLEAVLYEISELLKKKILSTKRVINQLLKSEKQAEWTVNPYYMDIFVKLHSKIKEFKEKRNQNPIDSKSQVQVNDHFIELNDCKIEKKVLMSPDIMNCHSDQEMNVLSIQISCFAYWKVFLKRFTDYCNLIILQKLIYYFRYKMAAHLEKKFSPNQNEESENNQYISEEPAISQKRKEIKRSLENLENALNHLHKLF